MFYLKRHGISVPFFYKGIAFKRYKIKFICSFYLDLQKNEANFSESLVFYNFLRNLLFQSVRVIVKISLNKNYGSSLVTGAARKVAKRSDKVGKLTWRGSLGRHITYKISFFFSYAL